MPESATESGEALHRAAEEKSALMPEPQELLSSDEVRQVLQEVRILRIELEMQKEILRRTQVALEVSRARYLDLYDLAPEGYFTLSEHKATTSFYAETLRYLAEVRMKEQAVQPELLPDAARNLPYELRVHQIELEMQNDEPLTRFILPEDRTIYYRHRQRLLATNKPQSCELRLVKRDGSLFLARLEATAAQGVDGAPEYRALLSDSTELKSARDSSQQGDTP